MVIGIIGLAVVSILAVIIATATGLKGPGFSTGIWPVVFILPIIALPIGVVLIIVLLVVNWRQRSRDRRP